MKVPILNRMSARVERLEYVLRQVHHLHLMDEFGRFCTCGKVYPCDTARVIDGLF